MRFIAESAEERARWFKALQTVSRTASDSVMKQSFITDISRLESAGRSPRSGPEQRLSHCHEFEGIAPDETLLVEGKPIDLSTLTDISQFLNQQND